MTIGIFHVPGHHEIVFFERRFLGSLDGGAVSRRSFRETDEAVVVFEAVEREVDAQSDDEASDQKPHLLSLLYLSVSSSK